MTAKQRAKIYRKAAENVFYDFDFMGCLAILNSAKLRNVYLKSMYWYSGGVTSFVITHFPEFGLFKPPYPAGKWWELGSNSRILALLFCEQIALDSKD